MAKISRVAQREVEAAFLQYETDVKTAGLRPSTEKTYIVHAWNFVRWIRDDFNPGATLRK